MLGCNQLKGYFTTVIGRRAIRTSYGRIIPVPFFRFLALTVLARSATLCKQSRDYLKKSMHVWSVLSCLEQLIILHLSIYIMSADQLEQHLATRSYVDG